MADFSIDPSRTRALRTIGISLGGLSLLLLYGLWTWLSPDSLLSKMLHRPPAQPARVAASAPLSLTPAVTAPANDEEPPPLLFRALSPDEARQVNALMPLWKGVAVKAAPFKLMVTDPSEREQAVQCLSEAVYYEAGFEPLAGAQAVAQVVLNRLRHPRFPKTVCGVVFQGSSLPTGCQFSFTCDGARSKPADPKAWARARQIAEAALGGFVQAQTGVATHYHADYVVPYWMPTMNKLAVLGQQIFYRWTSADGGLTATYAGSELGAMIGVPPGAMTPKIKFIGPQTLLLTTGPRPPQDTSEEREVDSSAGLKSAEHATPIVVAPAQEVALRVLAAPDISTSTADHVFEARPAALPAAPSCFGPSCSPWR